SFYHQPEAAFIQQLITYASSVPREAALEALTSQAALDLADELPKLTMPVMVIHGRYDQARPVAHAEFLASHLPHAELRMLETGHTPMVEDAAAYEQALLRLCAKTGIKISQGKERDAMR